MACYIHFRAREEVLTLMATDATSPHAASEALFGSCARGDADRLSDRDVLLVDDDVRVLQARAGELQAQGYSVASYTFRKLEHLATSGALFVQHLKLEASIMADSGDRLTRLLKNYRPKVQYQDELTANSELAALVEAIPPGRASELWAADVLYVTVRNFGILWLAGQGKYLFSYDSILDELQRSGVLDAGAAAALRKLRFLKTLYRTSERASVGFVAAKVRAALHCLPREHFPRVIRVVGADEILLAPGPTGDSSAYLVLRDLEKRLLATQTVRRQGAVDEVLDSLTKWVRDPRVYANLSAALAPEIRRRLALYASPSHAARAAI